MRVLGLHFAGRGYCVLPYIISQLSYIYIIYMSTLLFLCVSLRREFGWMCAYY